MRQNHKESGMARPHSGFLLGFLALLLVGTTAIISGCSLDFGNDNVPNVNAPSDAAPPSAPQVPESMKTGTVSGDGYGTPPQGL
jgi:hypothetical protein